VPADPHIPSVPQIKVAGSTLLPAISTSVIEIRVEHSIGVPSKAIMRFNDPEFTVVDNGPFGIGKAVAVTIGESTVFDGEVTAFGIEQTAMMNHELVVEASDKSHRLGHKTVVRTFQKSTYADVIKSIADEMGLSAQVVSMPVTHEYLIQAHSNTQMLDMLTARTGTEWFVDGNKLVVRKRPSPTAAKKFTLGEDLIRFKARFTSGGAGQQATVRSWDPTTKQPIVATKKVARNGSESSSPAGMSRVSGDIANFTGTYLSGTNGAESAEEAQQLAAAYGDRQASSELSARGEVTGSPGLRAGTHVEIKGAGVKLSGLYYVTNVEHVFNKRDLVTRFTAGGLQNATIVDLLGGRSASGGGWGSTGLVVGLVTNNKDPENMGRVRVKFPTLSDEHESAWARVVSFGGGAERGMMLHHNVNDEVIIGFEHGDLRKPFVLGGVWNGKDKPPVGPDGLLEQGSSRQWVLKSRAGHLLTFDDATETKDSGVTIKHKDGTTMLRMTADKVELISNSKPLEIKSGKASIILDAGKIKITGTSIELTADQDVKAAGLNVELKAKVGAKLEGATVAVKATATNEVSSGGPMTVKGAIVQIN
jgi:phage protein D